MKFDPGMLGVALMTIGVMLILIFGVAAEVWDRQRKATPCGPCRGRGFLRIRTGIDWADPSWKETTVTEMECGSCQGKGVLPYGPRS